MNDFTTIKPAIIKMLSIIEYDDDKDIFADELLMLCSQRTILEVIKHLPLEKRDEIREKLSKNDTDEYIISVLNEAMPTQSYRDTFIKQVQKTLLEYITEMRSTLTEYRFQVLEEFLKVTFTPSNT